MLFHIEQKYSRSVDEKFYDFPIIVSNYTVLHFDEYPILYCGKNADRYGNWVVGSLMCESEDDNIPDTFRHIHVVLSGKDFMLFMEGEISYRELIEKNKMIFVIDTNIKNDILTTYCLPPSEIPADYLPNSKYFFKKQS